MSESAEPLRFVEGIKDRSPEATSLMTKAIAMALGHCNSTDEAVQRASWLLDHVSKPDLIVAVHDHYRSLESSRVVGCPDTTTSETWQPSDARSSETQSIGMELVTATLTAASLLGESTSGDARTLDASEVWLSASALAETLVKSLPADCFPTLAVQKADYIFMRAVRPLVTVHVWQRFGGGPDKEYQS